MIITITNVTECLVFANLYSKNIFWLKRDWSSQQHLQGSTIISILYKEKLRDKEFR